MEIKKRDFYLELASYCETERKLTNDSKDKCNQLVSQIFKIQMVTNDSKCPSSLIKDLDKYHMRLDALEKALKDALRAYNTLKRNEKLTNIEDVTEVKDILHLGFLIKKK